MKHLFIPYELALLAKDKGFDEPCFAGWSNGGSTLINMAAFCDYMENYHKEKHISTPGQILAPLYQQIIDWVRDKHNLYISVGVIPFESGRFFEWSISNWDNCIKQSGVFNSYYEALDDVIKEALNMIF